METRIYDAHGSTDLTNVGAYAGGVVPLDGDTINISVTTAPTVPVSAAGTYHLTWTAAGPATFTPSLFVAVDATTILGVVTVSHAAGTVTLGENFAPLGFTLNTAGTIAGNSKTVTVGASGFINSTSIITGTVNVDLSAGAGPYTQTAGTIATGGVLNVTAGTGAITGTALTKTGTAKINITMAQSANIGWYLGASPIDVLTIATGKTGTQTDIVVFKSSTGPGTLYDAGLWDVFWTPATAADVCDGLFTGSAEFYPAPSVTGLTIDTVLNRGAKRISFYPFTGNWSLTISGITGTGGLRFSSWDTSTFTLTINGNSSGAGIVFGASGTSDRIGALVLGPGTHEWTGNIGRAGTGTAHALTAQAGAVVRFGGNVDLTGIVTDLTSSTWFATATGKTITGGASIAAAGCDIFANGFALLTLTALGGAIRSWNKCTDGGSNGAAVAFHPGTPDIL